MSIAAIYETGWELGDSRDELTSNASGNVAGTTTPKTGTYSCSLNLVSGTGNYREHTASIAQCQVACHIRHAQIANTRDVFVLSQGGTVAVRVQWDGTNSQWVILCGATEVARVSDATFAVTNTYFHIGVDIKIHASAGWVYVYRDGTLVVSFSGDTDNGSTTFNRLHPGHFTAGQAWTSGGILDDLVWFDSTGEVAPAAIPDYRLYALTPNGNGNYNEWDGSDGNAVNNYLLVDEIPANDETDYLTTATANDTESFTMTTFTIPSGFAVEEVIPLAIARKIDALGALGLKLGTRLASTDLLSSTKALGTGYTIYLERQTTKPGGGAWAQADIDGLEVIVEAAA